MKRYLSIALFCAIFVVQLFVFVGAVHAQAASPGPSANDWVQDEDVTFAGKLAVRSKDLLNWVIQNYQWANVTPSSGTNPFDAIWVPIRNIVYGVLGLFILVAAFLLITTRGKSLTIRKFVPRFVLVLILVTLSLSLVQFIFQIGDVTQSFFLKKQDGNFISDADLLAISFNYKDFIGYRLFGPEFKESVFISTLMVKLTALTYYSMFTILIVRKIILWFFLVVSPIFPLLLMFYPLRNTAKIWFGEFLRWLLYGPLFAIFLAGLVALWSQGKGIPLTLNGVPCDQPPADESAQNFEYKTSISILLGGPCQQVTLYNSLNTTDSFIQYLVALLMLWMVIIVPFILLKIFLDYFKDFNVSESSMVKQLVNSGSPLMARYGGWVGRGTPPPGSPQPSGSTGQAMQIPSAAMSPVVNEIQQHMQQTAERTHELAEAYKETATESINQSIGQSTNMGYEAGVAAASTAVAAQQAIAEILNLTNLSVPTMRDVAKYETGLMSSNTSSSTTQEAHQITEALKRIGGKSSLTTPSENTRFTQIREKLTTEAGKGNAVANSVLSASMGGGLPESNQVQQVNLDDYEEVKKLWMENFRKLDVPVGEDGKPRERKEWLEQEVKKIPEVIELLLSGDPKQVEKGKNMVAKILPFLLLGGFSKQEIVAYLKAKLEAAKAVLGEMVTGEKAEDDKVEVEKKVDEKPKTMTMEAEVDDTSDGPSKPKLPPIDVPEKSPEPSVTLSPDHPATDSGEPPIPDSLKVDKDK